MMKFTGIGYIVKANHVEQGMTQTNDMDVEIRFIQHLSGSFSSLEQLFKSMEKMNITIDNERGT
jgi:hypothetical protein